MTVVFAFRDADFLADLGFATGFLVALRFTGDRLAGVLLTAFDAVAFFADVAGFLAGVFFTCRRPTQFPLDQILHTGSCKASACCVCSSLGGEPVT